jgi:hypothetical protein
VSTTGENNLRLLIAFAYCLEMRKARQDDEDDPSPLLIRPEPEEEAIPTLENLSLSGKLCLDTASGPNFVSS